MTTFFWLNRTSGMTTTTARKRKPEYDPSRQWGLQPEPAAGSSVYMVSGHVVGGATGDIFMAEKLGREAQEKAKRRLGQDADKELRTLLDRDKEGMRAVTKARELAARMLKASESGKEKGKGKKANKGKGKVVEGEDETEEPMSASAPAKPAYSASIIKHLGFDPAAKAGRKRTEDLTIQRKVRLSQYHGMLLRHLFHYVVGSAGRSPGIEKGNKSRAKARAEDTFWSLCSCLYDGRRCWRQCRGTGF